MESELGLRERKKLQTRERIADAAAALFAARGYEAVAVQDVARAIDVSDQTIYNYFPSKQDLVLDRVDEFLELYRRAVLHRAAGMSPARALQPLVDADIDRYRHAELDRARGEFPAQCVVSTVLRRFSLEFRERQVEAVSEAITLTCPHVDPIVARAHSAALIAVVQAITDRIGRSILDGGPSEAVASDLARAATLAFNVLDRTFHTITNDQQGATS